MVLLAGSLIFYALGEPRYLVLLMVSVLLNYMAGLHLEKSSRQKGKDKRQKKSKYEKRHRRMFVAAITVNIGVLVFFKVVAGKNGLPLGISFYTFQVMSYLIDVYQGEQKRETSFILFATYVTTTPQLISVPIVR